MIRSHTYCEISCIEVTPGVDKFVLITALGSVVNLKTLHLHIARTMHVHTNDKIVLCPNYLILDIVVRDFT